MFGFSALALTGILFSTVFAQDSYRLTYVTMPRGSNAPGTVLQMVYRERTSSTVQDMIQKDGNICVERLAHDLKRIHEDERIHDLCRKYIEATGKSCRINVSIVGGFTEGGPGYRFWFVTPLWNFDQFSEIVEVGSWTHALERGSCRIDDRKLIGFLERVVGSYYDPYFKALVMASWKSSRALKDCNIRHAATAKALKKQTGKVSAAVPSSWLTEDDKNALAYERSIFGWKSDLNQCEVEIIKANAAIALLERTMVRAREKALTAH